LTNPSGSQLIHSELDADRLDFLLRDSLFCGVKYGIYDLDRLLISLTSTDEGHLIVSRKGIYVAEEFVFARFYMYRQVYIHKTKRAFEIMVSKVMQELLSNGIIQYPAIKENIEEELTDKDDIWLISQFRSLLKNKEIDEKVRKLIKMILYREPIKLVGEVEESISKMDERFSSEFHFLRELKNRRDFIEQLGKAQIPEDGVFIDEPRIDIKQAPYIFIPSKEYEEKQYSILVYDNKNKPIDIAMRKGSMIREISTRLLGIVRVYTFEKYARRLRDIIDSLLKTI